MLVILVSLISYVVLGVIVAVALKSIPVMLLILILYILPPLVNIIISNSKYIRKYCNFKFASFSLPTVSLIFYLVFAVIVTLSGGWQEYVVLNSKNIGDVSVEITENILSVSQIVFVILIYYALSGFNYIVRRRKEEHASN